MSEMFKMPKISQFKDVIREVKHKVRFNGLDDQGNPVYVMTKLPKLKFVGSIKLHGSNAGLVYTWNELSFEYDFHTQSRNNVITPMNDNAGFATFMYSNNTDIILSQIMKAHPMDYTPKKIAVFGEWCGGNIQDKVAINGLPKMFVIFAIKIDDEWVSNDVLMQVSNPSERIYNILDYPHYEILIDMESPEYSVAKLEELTLEVEKECPVGKAFDKLGIGEGIVWKCVDDEYRSSNFWFKVKGDEHAKGSGKIKKLASVDIERFENIKTLVDDLVTERRLEQGFEYLAEQKIAIERKNIGTYIKWVIGDVVAEELSTIVGNGFEVKDIAGSVSNKARDYFFEKEKASIGL